MNKILDELEGRAEVRERRRRERRKRGEESRQDKVTVLTHMGGTFTCSH